MKRKSSLIILILLASFALNAIPRYQSNLDSLNARLGKTAGREKLEVYLELSRAYWYSDPNKGLDLGSQALALAQSLEYEREVAKAMYYLGNAYHINGQLDYSLDYLLKAYRFAQKHKFTSQLADISQQLAMVYYQSKKLNKTYQYTLEANEIYSSLNDMLGLAKCNNLFGLYYRGIHQYDEAIKHFKEGLQIAKEFGNDELTASILNDLGSLYAEKDDPRLAIDTYLEAVKYHSTESPKYKTGEFELDLANMFIQNGNLKEAVTHLNKGFLIANKLKSRQLKQDYYRVLASYHNKKGNNIETVKAYQNLQAYQDSIANDQLANKIEELNNRHTIEIKDAESRKWMQEAQLKDLKLTRQFIIGLSILLILAIAIFILVIRYRNNLKDNELLYLRNSLVNQHQEQLIDAMKRLKNSEDKLRTANDTKDKMFSLIAHDLRGAVGNISNGLRMYLGEEDLNLSEEDKTEFLEALFHSSDNAYELLENLLFWAKNQTKTMQANKQMVDASSIINSNIGLLADLAKVKSINLFTSENENVEVYVDWNMINTVLRNLISNAIKFTNKDGNIEIKSIVGENFVKISVIDDGIGMFPEQIDNIYDGKTTDGTAAEKGTGLGLTLCRDFLVLNQGQMMVESEIDKGSTFSFVIPRRPMSREKFEELLSKEHLFSLVNS